MLGRKLSYSSNSNQNELNEIKLIKIHTSNYPESYFADKPETEKIKFSQCSLDSLKTHKKRNIRRF